jgi:formylglycine-generating enzyme required for sulfatase activity
VLVEDRAREFTLGRLAAIDRIRPSAIVSYYEADAFARWAGARLPTEDRVGTGRRRFPSSATARSDLPAPRNRACAVADRPALGDVWEWCRQPTAPTPASSRSPGSLGEYNGKFMCNQLVVRGGSCVDLRRAPAPDLPRFFYPHDRWQFLGFRLARNA